MVGDGWDFALSIPEGWWVWDPDGATRAATAARQVDERIAEQPELAHLRQHLIDMLLSYAEDADSKSVTVAATLWHLVDDVPIVADLRVVDGIREAPDSVEDELEAVLRAGRHPSDLGEPEVGVVDLPAGRAVRLRTLAETDRDEKGETLVLDTVQYSVPVPDHPDMVIILGSTPSLSLADQLIETIDWIARTLEFLPYP